MEKIGAGMGVVYKARDFRLGCFVALKFISNDLERSAGHVSEALATLNEAMATARLNGDHFYVPAFRIASVGSTGSCRISNGRWNMISGAWRLRNALEGQTNSWLNMAIDFQHKRGGW